MSLPVSSLELIQIADEQETGVELKRGQIKKYFQVGKSDIKTGVQAAKIFFNEEEVRKVKVGSALSRSFVIIEN